MSIDHYPGVSEVFTSWDIIGYTNCHWVGTPPACTDATCGVGEVSVCESSVQSGRILDEAEISQSRTYRVMRVPHVLGRRVEATVAHPLRVKSSSPSPKTGSSHLVKDMAPISQHLSLRISTTIL